MMLAALALAASAPAKGIEQIYNFPDVDSCGYWTQHRRQGEGQSQVWEGWILGFIAGLNVFGPNNGNIAPDVQADGLLGWIDQYCTAHPLERITFAGLKLADELKRRQSH